MKKILALLIGLCLLVWSGVSDAGNLAVHDYANWIPKGDLAALNSEAGAWPFDVHILVENADSRDILEDHAHLAVTGPNVMAIAVDPTHHRTVTRFGTNTGVKPGDYDSITQAGNAHFRAHEVRQGLEAIVVRASASRQAVTAISASNEPVVLKEGLGTGTWFCIVVGFFALGGFIVWLVRKQKRDRENFERALDDNRLETSELVSRNTRAIVDDEDTYTAQYPTKRTYKTKGISAHISVPTVQPSTIVVNSGSNNNDLLTGMLIGEELSRPTREYVPAPVYAPAPVPSYTPSPSYSNDDSGGSSSSWDSGSSSWDSGSSSSDSGGSSSSWDSGSSSFDFGGGGGSSDW